MKRCACCKEQKPLSEFHKQKSAKDGYNSWCKKCSNANNIVYMRQRRGTRFSRGTNVHGEILQLTATDALTRFELRLNFIGIERLI